MGHLYLGDVTIHWSEDGDPAGAPVVFLHALGLDLTIWDAVIPRLPRGLRLVRLDMRGHGGSSVPPPPYKMGALVHDAERVIEALGLRDCVLVGISIGGMIAQGLAAKRLDLVRALVLADTAVKIGTPAIWAERVAEVEAHGTAAIAEATLARWFPPGRRASPEAGAMRELLLACDRRGYAGAAAAVGGTDLLTTTAGLRLPALVIAGSEDGSTPPDLVRETAGLIPGARFELIRGAGHLPPVDHPAAFAGLLAEFLDGIAHGQIPGAGRP